MRTKVGSMLDLQQPAALDVTCQLIVTRKTASSVFVFERGRFIEERRLIILFYILKAKLFILLMN